MTEQERDELLSKYIDLLNLCESEEAVNQSTALKDFEVKHQGDAKLAERMQTSKTLKILFLDGKIE